jgi:hypothetical protein
MAKGGDRGRIARGLPALNRVASMTVVDVFVLAAHRRKSHVHLRSLDDIAALSLEDVERAVGTRPFAELGDSLHTLLISASIHYGTVRCRWIRPWRKSVTSSTYTIIRRMRRTRAACVGAWWSRAVGRKLVSRHGRRRFAGRSSRRPDACRNGTRTDGSRAGAFL